MRSRSNCNLEVLVFEERGKPEINLSERRREPTTNSTTYGVDAGIRTGATLVEGECSHHCATLPPLSCAPVVSTKRTRISQCNDHRLDELVFYPFWDLQASEKNNFIGRVNLSFTMKTMFRRHSQKSINSKLKFKVASENHREVFESYNLCNLSVY